MKIGFSLGKCVRDIVKGEVQLDDVLFVVSRTLIREADQMDSLWHGYCYEPSYWMGLDRDACINTCKELMQSGRLHQPRMFGKYFGSPVAESHVWMDIALPTLAMEDHPMVEAAYKKYKMLERLAIEGKQPTEEETRKKLLT